MLDYDGLAVFFSWTMDATDWANWHNCRATKVMLPWGLATEPVLRRLASTVRTKQIKDAQGHVTGTVQVPISIVLRFMNDELLTPQGMLQGQLRDKQSWAGGRIVAAILGVEPDDGTSFEWGQPWGNNAGPGQRSKIDRHLDALENAIGALEGHGVKLIAPGWIQRPFREYDEPQPGQITWRELTHPQVYNELDGIGVHIYQDDWWSDVNLLRYCYDLQHWCRLAHKPIWIDEINVNAHSTPENPRPEINDVWRMVTVLEMMKLLLPTGKAWRLGKYIEFFCPFVSNGLGNAYPEYLIMRDPAAYQKMAMFMELGGYIA